MKKIHYIGILAIILLFSCSKDQPLTPIASSETAQPSMISVDKTSGEEVFDSSVSGSGDITDPEKEDKEKTNKKAKN